MNLKSFKMLEFQKIIAMLKKNAITSMGIEKCENLLPDNEIDKVRKLQRETTEAVSISLRVGMPPIIPVSDFTSIAQKIKIGGVLIPKELLNTATILKSMRELKDYYRDTEHEDLEILNLYLDNLYSNLNVEKEIFRCIKGEEEIDDHASTELYNIRRHMQDAESKIKDKLNNIIHASETSKFLQDQVVTFRNDRYVIPVKQEYKNEIKGLIHDSSASGSTIFIEPSAVFNINNEIKELKIKEELEIQRILALLTQMIDPIFEDILYGITNLGNIDFAFAKAKLSLELNCFEPKINDIGYINLKKARHPLIDKQSVVPIDIWLGKEYKSLIITGPNTGGKTVTLKTVGLFALMMQSGLHLPAMENSEMAVFENIYADIGDEQSIEQSLSTFSSHIKNVIEITNKVTKNDLVLLDELGSGTDPVEGAALAMSILEYLKEVSCLTMATTHYSELKTYAMNTANVENASCEFDVDTLRPTYKLLIGVPGRSNAFAISKKLGLSEEILDKANTFLSSESIKFEEILSKMESDRLTAEKEKEYATRLLKEAEEEKAKVEKESKKLEDKKEEIIHKARIEAREVLLDAKAEADEIIKDLTNLRKDKTKNVNKAAEEARQKIKGSIANIQKDLVKPQKQSKNTINPKDIKVGMTVYVASIDANATILSLPDRKENVQIQSGIMKLNVHVSGIEKIPEVKSAPKVKINSMIKSKAKDIETEIKLLGMTVQEAIVTLEKYLDDAYLAGLTSVRVVHGKGSGQLRKGVQDYLRKNPHVSSFRLGMYGEGDSGVTIVELK
ncbi:MAG: endonuclease MutS2 [Clostridia bacterium]|nr:endonuclease MutS2 [Clostridia bacterium]